MRKGLLVVPVITLLVLCVMLAACAPAEPQIVEKTVVETVIVEKEVVIEKPVPETVIVEKEVPVEKLVVQTVIVEIEKEIIVTPEPADASTRITTVDIPFEELWAESGHADRLAEAFVHWNEDAEQIVPAGCANCHSTTGYLDYLGADGSEIWSVDNEHPIGSTVECVACHNAATQKLDSVLFPSGVEITDLGAEARCMVCHQGRTYLGSVEAAIEGAGVPDDDTPSGDIRFVNIHYFSAGATEYGSLTHGGYEYPGMAYDGRLDHVAEFDTCVECHDPHTLEVDIESCAECHTGVETVDDLHDIRERGSVEDYDGDGDVTEGIYYEVAGLRDTLYTTMQAYAANNIATPLAYDSNRYPYFFIDANEDGSVGEDESGGFNAWTGRLLKAAYNYQLATKDPGGYAHGGKYLIQLLFDSIEDLNRVLDAPIDMSAAQRDDAGHFAGSSEAFRHWDADGMVSASCTKCHTGTGLPFYLEHGVSIEQTSTNGLMCITCHDNLTEYTIHTVETVTFPSGATLDSESPQTNLCLNCHQGRESGASVRNLIGDLDDDETSDTLRFLNVHYFAAGASLFGAEAGGAYEYDEMAYAGRFEHVAPYSNCTDCHSTHGLTVKVEECVDCHPTATDGVDAIRMSAVDFDGDGETDEGLQGEVKSLHDALYVAMQEYSAAEVGSTILYDAHSYPYFFNDTNDNSELDEEEVDRANGFNTWTPRLLRAAYNYQFAMKDPGAFAHNGPYILQVLYDTLADLGADTDGMTRPD